MKTPMLFYPEPVVGAFILNPANEILLVKSYKWKDVWTIPGGHIELGESIKSAVVREAEEEVGLKVNFIEIFAIFDAINPKAFYKPKHFIFLECLCKTIGKYDPIIDNDEIQQYKWSNINKSFELNLEKHTKKSLILLKNKHINP